MTYAEIHGLRVRYWMAGWTLYEFGSTDKEELRSKARERRKWVNIFGTRDRRKVINWAFLSSVSSFLCSSPECVTSLDLGRVYMASARVSPPPDLSQWEVEFPRAPDPPKGHPERYRSVAGLLSLYEYVRGMIVQCFPFLSFSLIRFMQPRRSAPKEGDNVTAARNPGWVTAVLYSQLATSLRSQAITLPIHLHLLSLVSTFANVFL